MRKGEQYLMERDRRILHFVNRYRAVTADMLAVRIFDRQPANVNVARVIRKLVDRRLLRKVSYGGQQYYLVLTRRGAREIGAAARTPRPLTEQSLPVVLAIAWYCVRSGEDRMMAREFRERYPERWRPEFQCSSYYVFRSEDLWKLGMLLVDRGGTARRIKGKIRRIVMQRESISEYMSLINARMFRVTVLTGVQTQQDRIRRQLGCGWYRGVEVTTELIPELGELLTID